MADKELQVAEKQEVAAQGGEFTREGAYFSPAVDIYESDKELLILADMPGVKPDGVDIEVKEGILTIEGKVPQAATASGEPLLNEYKQGNYFRSFRITDTVDTNKIAAAISNGVLKVTLPKMEKAIPRKIPITVG
ncbi:MAG: Hsp20/alpha crystallin family protein [Desulfomonilaceae bacterium]